MASTRTCRLRERSSKMSMSWLQCWLVAIFVTSAFLLQESSAQNGPGVDYGQDGDNLPSPATVVQFLQSKGVKSIRLYGTPADTMSAFANSGIDLIVSIPNADVTSANLASGVAAAQAWLNTNVSPYVSTTTIKLIAVGNEVTDAGDANLLSAIVPAMQNLNTALQQMGLSIKVSTPLSANVLATSYPPSQGAFQGSLVGSFINPVLNFLSQTGSTFMINIYPYFTYLDNQQTIKLNYALLIPGSGQVQDPNSGKTYDNLLAQQLDAVISAMGAQGYPNLPLLLSESGWPSAGNSVATTANAASYNQNLVNWVVQNVGTPLRPGVAIETYIFSLFNEDLKGGDVTEQNFGLFYPNLSPVYNVNLQEIRRKRSHSKCK